MILLRTKGVQAKDNYLLFCWCWDLTDFFWRILLGIQNNFISLWSSFVVSADKTPACTGWLQCWVLPPGRWGPPPGPQQAVNSLVNMWNEQPSEVLHYRLPRGWFALSFLINWILLANNILICKRNFPRLGVSIGVVWNIIRQCDISLVESYALLQHIWRVWQQTASTVMHNFSRRRNIHDMQISTGISEGALLCESFPHSCLRGEDHSLHVGERRRSAVLQAVGLPWWTFIGGHSIQCWDLRQPVKRFTPRPLMSSDLK